MDATETPRFPTTRMCDGELLARFAPTARASDVFVSTTAKCGQTWLLALLHHLRSRGRDPGIGDRGLHAATPWLELPYDPGSRDAFERDARLAFLAGLPDPRVFKLHLNWEEIPRDPGCTAPVVTVTRDPRDVPFSMFSHLMALQEDLRPPGLPSDFPAYFERWMDLGHYFSFVRSFWPHRSDPDVLWLRYEDMKSDLPGVARRLVTCLGWDVDDAALARAVALVDFRRMQRTEHTDIFLDSQRIWKEGTRFFREGGVGLNRARLTDDQEARIVARARREFAPDCFAFVMSLDAR